ncbi:spondin domain-containing protein [Pseudorhodoferax sp.]|jgi:hypothetical protein|uniref:spondin domain-containing protein n=1 Tax=Pseudorhodoferax sp. TaxID=1993553 RepID=UPI001B635209|nr:spondin domain-containing protein [Pseudorhodoferax sp.]MBP8145078.1 spondin domain-containing protein [Inhella sp.]
MRNASLLSALGLLLAAGSAQAETVRLTVTVQNLAPANGIAFAPLHVGFGAGSFDAFNLGAAATAPIISVAEGGAGGAWQAAFAAAEPDAVRGTIGGLLLSGASAQMSFLVDSASQGFFTFASMVVPSNDFFIGNDDPREYALFDANGALQINQITLRANEIWDAGSEVFDPTAAAFVGDNGLRTDQNSVVAFNFAELAAFNGLLTGAGYNFQSGLGADSEVYRISFTAQPVPEPASIAMLLAGLGVVGASLKRRRG